MIEQLKLLKSNANQVDVNKQFKTLNSNARRVDITE